MFAKDFDSEKYIDSYLQKINYNTYIADDVNFETEMNDLLDCLDADDSQYDASTLDVCMDALYAVLKKICGENLQNRTDIKDIMDEIDYIDIVRNLIAQNLSEEEMEKELYNRLSAECEQAVAVVNQRKEQQELFAANHPVISNVNKRNIFIGYTILACIIFLYTIVPFFRVWFSGFGELLQKENSIGGIIFFLFVSSIPIVGVVMVVFYVISMIRRIKEGYKQ